MKLVTKPDKRDRTVEPRVGAKVLRNNDAAVPIEAENLDIAVECDREFVALVRIVRQAAEKPIDLFRKSFAAAIERALSLCAPKLRANAAKSGFVNCVPTTRPAYSRS